MNFLTILIATIVGTFLLKPLIKRVPYLFYGIAIAVDVVFVVCTMGYIGGWVQNASFLLIQKCTLALAMFIVVMYIGVFSKQSSVRRYLEPIRAELSIIAWLLSLGHMAVYLMTYLERLMAGALTPTTFTSLIVALVLLVLLIVLGVTSFNVVKRHVRKDTWKNIQRLAYPFFALVYVHLMLLLGPAAFAGGRAATVSVAIYSVIFIGYGVFRVLRYVLDRRNVPEAKSTHDATVVSDELDFNNSLI